MHKQTKYPVNTETPEIAKAFTNYVAMKCLNRKALEHPKSEFYHPLHNKSETSPNGNPSGNLKICLIGML